MSSRVGLSDGEGEHNDWVESGGEREGRDQV